MPSPNAERPVLRRRALCRSMVRCSYKRLISARIAFVTWWRTSELSKRTARGAGFSYAAASFGDNIIVQEMTAFNRYLHFMSETALFRVEAGISLDALEHGCHGGVARFEGMAQQSSRECDSSRVSVPVRS